MKSTALFVCISGLISILRADSMLPIGTWVRRANNDGISSTMVIEAVGAGRKLTFKIAIPGGGTSTLTVTTQVDGKDAAVSVDGRPSGQTMAIRAIDDHHAINIIKMNGSPTTTQKSQLSADGKVIKVESSAMAPGQQNGFEYWDKK